MNYENLYADVVNRSKASAIRELLKIIARPEIISFAGGLPDPNLFPDNAIDDVLHRVMAETPREALQYGTTEGQKALKQELIKLVKETENIAVSEDQILVISASQQALDMSARIFINPGDAIITANPTYLGALQAFQVAGADIIGAQSDNDGIIPENVEKQLSLLQAQNRPCKFIYLVPDFQNPTGTTITEERRIKILEIAKKYHTLILEDSPYRQVRFEGKAPRTFYELDGGAGNVLTLFTFSKIFVPGFRLGFIIGPAEVIRKFVILKQAMDLCTSPFLQLVTAKFLSLGLLQGHIEKMTAVYRQKRDLMLKTLAEVMPTGITWTKPEGGLFLWVTLPKHIDATKMLKKAVENKVAYVAGVDFYPKCNVFNDLRLNFSYSSPEQIVEGLNRLAQTIKQSL